MRGIVVAAAVGVLAACQPGHDEPTWVEAERGELVLEVEVSGTMRAVESTRVGPPPIPGLWNYKIQMMAPEGEEVKAGQPVLVLDMTDLKHLLDEKTAERDSAATQLEAKVAAAKLARQDEKLAIAHAEAELRKAKLKADAPADITAEIELQKARLDLSLAKEKLAYQKRKSASAKRRDQAEIKRWRSKRDRAEERVEEISAAIGQMSVAAPRDGTVIHKTDWQGNKKKAGDNAWRGETVLEVASLAEMKAEGEVDEVDIAKIAVDQPVSLRLDAQADVDLRGEIEEISHTVQRASPETPQKVIRIDIALPTDLEVRLRPGMRFRGTIEVDRLVDVLLAPIDAIEATPEGPVARRWTGTAIETVPVSLGARNAQFVVITEGLDDSDRLVRPGEDGT